MSEFILIKNVDGSGQMLLRADNIIRVYDTREGAFNKETVVVYDDSEEEGKSYLNTASTAAEVLEAIREARPLATHFTSGGSDTLYLTKEEYEQRKGFEGSSK